ncbi:EamA family transporter [Micromonospora sp. NBC_01796]|uniref:EamA family transporter n=1 Tax=Micromonospora sp. NBC_01796 TaxID=2975987 RepID=UPI002DDA7F97|nr:EamA family transporter [Micromonospora sp. NBC_01796]WSA85422.1 DMT family transporter [Micromonospora sp. NBC_01796]
MLVSSTPMAAARHRTGVGLSYLALAGVLWGTGGLLGSLLGRHAGLSPVAVATYRLAVGGVLLVLVLLLSGRPLPRSRPAWSRIVVLGMLFALYQACYFGAVALTSVSLATLVTIGTSPVLVLAADWATTRRRASRRMIGAVCLAVVGLGLLVGLPAGGYAPSAVLASAGLALLSAGGFATVTRLGARPVAGLDEQAAVGLGFGVGGLLLAPFAVSTVGLGFQPSLLTVGLLVALGAAPTALAYTFYFRGLRTVGASTAVVVALLEPLTGALLAAILLHDRLGAPGVAGAVLLAVAVVLAGSAFGRSEPS